MSIIQTEYSQDELQKLLGLTADSDTDTRQYYLSNKKVALPYGNYCKGKGQVL